MDTPGMGTPSGSAGTAAGEGRGAGAGAEAGHGGRVASGKERTAKPRGRRGTGDGRAGTKGGQGDSRTPPAVPGAGLMEHDQGASWLRPPGSGGRLAPATNPRAGTALSSSPSAESSHPEDSALMPPPPPRAPPQMAPPILHSILATDLGPQDEPQAPADADGFVHPTFHPPQHPTQSQNAESPGFQLPHSSTLQPQPPTLPPQTPNLPPQPPTLQPQPPTLQPQPPTLQPQPPTLPPQTPNLPPQRPTLQTQPPTLLPQPPTLPPQFPGQQAMAPLLASGAPHFQPPPPHPHAPLGGGPGTLPLAPPDQRAPHPNFDLPPGTYLPSTFFNPPLSVARMRRSGGQASPSGPSPHDYPFPGAPMAPPLGPSVPMAGAGAGAGLQAAGRPGWVPHFPGPGLGPVPGPAGMFRPPMGTGNGLAAAGFAAAAQAQVQAQAQALGQAHLQAHLQSQLQAQARAQSQMQGNARGGAQQEAGVGQSGITRKKKKNKDGGGALSTEQANALARALSSSTDGPGLGAAGLSALGRHAGVIEALRSMEQSKGAPISSLTVGDLLVGLMQTAGATGAASHTGARWGKSKGRGKHGGGGAGRGGEGEDSEEEEEEEREDSGHSVQRGRGAVRFRLPGVAGERRGDEDPGKRVGKRRKGQGSWSDGGGGSGRHRGREGARWGSGGAPALNMDAGLPDEGEEDEEEDEEEEVDHVPHKVLARKPPVTYRRYKPRKASTMASQGDFVDPEGIVLALPALVTIDRGTTAGVPLPDGHPDNPITLPGDSPVEAGQGSLSGAPSPKAVVPRALSGEIPLVEKVVVVQTFVHNMLPHLCEICQHVVTDGGAPLASPGGSQAAAKASGSGSKGAPIVLSEKGYDEEDDDDELVGPSGGVGGAQGGRRGKGVEFTVRDLVEGQGGVEMGGGAEGRRVGVLVHVPEALRKRDEAAAQGTSAGRGPGLVKEGDQGTGAQVAQARQLMLVKWKAYARTQRDAVDIRVYEEDKQAIRGLHAKVDKLRALLIKKEREIWQLRAQLQAGRAGGGIQEDLNTGMPIPHSSAGATLGVVPASGAPGPAGGQERVGPSGGQQKKSRLDRALEALRQRAGAASGAPVSAADVAVLDLDSDEDEDEDDEEEEQQEEEEEWGRGGEGTRAMGPGAPGAGQWHGGSRTRELQHKGSLPSQAHSSQRGAAAAAGAAGPVARVGLGRERDFSVEDEEEEGGEDDELALEDEREPRRMPSARRSAGGGSSVRGVPGGWVGGLRTGQGVAAAWVERGRASLFAFADSLGEPGVEVPVPLAPKQGEASESTADVILTAADIPPGAAESSGGGAPAAGTGAGSGVGSSEPRTSGEAGTSGARKIPQWADWILDKPKPVPPPADAPAATSGQPMPPFPPGVAPPPGLLFPGTPFAGATGVPRPPGATLHMSPGTRPKAPDPNLFLRREAMQLAMGLPTAGRGGRKDMGGIRPAAPLGATLPAGNRGGVPLLTTQGGATQGVGVRAPLGLGMGGRGEGPGAAVGTDGGSGAGAGAETGAGAGGGAAPPNLAVASGTGGASAITTGTGNVHAALNTHGAQGNGGLGEPRANLLTIPHLNPQPYFPPLFSGTSLLPLHHAGSFLGAASSFPRRVPRGRAVRGLGSGHTLGWPRGAPIPVRQADGEEADGGDAGEPGETPQDAERRVAFWLKHSRAFEDWMKRKGVPEVVYVLDWFKRKTKRRDAPEEEAQDRARAVRRLARLRCVKLEEAVEEGKLSAGQARQFMGPKGCVPKGRNEALEAQLAELETRMREADDRGEEYVEEGDEERGGEEDGDDEEQEGGALWGAQGGKDSAFDRNAWYRMARKKGKGKGGAGALQKRGYKHRARRNGALSLGRGFRSAYRSGSRRGGRTVNVFEELLNKERTLLESSGLGAGKGSDVGRVGAGSVDRTGSDRGSDRWSAVARLTRLFEEEEEDDDDEELYDDGEDSGDFDLPPAAGPP